jgi:hypothetical protein
MPDFAWSQVKPAGDPRLLIGRRRRPNGLDGVRVDLHVDTFQDLTQIAEEAIGRLSTTTARTFEAFAAIEGGEEHFDLVLDSSAEAAPDLVRLTRMIDDLDVVSAAKIQERPNLFYALCWPEAVQPIAAVKKIDPARAIQHARSFVFRDTLRRVENPDLILSDSVDFVIAGDRVGIARPTPFRELLADTSVAVDQVPQNVASVGALLAGELPMTSDSQVALVAAAQRRVSFARRLDLLRLRLAEVPISRAAVEAASARHLGDAKALVDANGNLSFTEDNVGLALDLLEGRLFEDDFSGEARRADRWSKR